MKRLPGWLQIPLLGSLRGYSWKKAGADCRAGLNVALLDFPQGMAYAMLAGLPVQFGLFCSAIGSITGPFFASSRFVMLGPTNATAVLLLSAFLTLDYTPEQQIIVLPLLLVMVAVVMIAGSFLRLASLVQYISRSVITGYLTAAALLIIVNQLKTALGLDIPKSGTFAGASRLLVQHIGDIHLHSALVALATLLIYGAVRRWLRFLPTVAVTLVAAALLYAWAGHFGLRVETLRGFGESGWPLTIPRIDLHALSKLANAALAISFLSVVESSSIAKTLAAQAGDRVDVNQQMFSMGVANFANAFGSGMPVSGSLTRSQLNYRSGAATSLSSIVSGLILVAGVFLFGPYVGLIPEPSLAAMVILVGISLIRPENIKPVIRATRTDAFVFLLTFVGGLFLSLDTAIYLGAAASIALFLQKASHPDLVEYDLCQDGAFTPRGPAQKKSVPDISLVHVEGDLFFGSTEIFLDQIRLIVEDPALKIIIIRLRNAYHIDATSALSIKELIRFARERECDVIIIDGRPDAQNVLERAGVLAALGEENFFPYNGESPNLPMSLALKRSQKLMDAKEANVMLFAKPSAKEGEGG